MYILYAHNRSKMELPCIRTTMPLLDTTNKQIIIPVPDSWSCWPMRPLRFTNIQDIAMPLVILQNYMERPYCWRHCALESQNIILTWKTHLYWLLFIVLECAVNATGEEKQSSVLCGWKPASYMTRQDMTSGAKGVMSIMGVTKHFLIAFLHKRNPYLAQMSDQGPVLDRY